MPDEFHPSDAVRHIWDQRIIEMMVESQTHGVDPYDVLRLIGLLGYDLRDIQRIADRWESMTDGSNLVIISEDELVAHSENMVSQIEEYLRDQPDGI